MPQAANLLANVLQAIGYAFLPALLLPFLALLTPRIHPFTRTLCDLINTFSHAIGSLVRWLYPLLVLSVVWTVFALSIFGIASTKLDESAIYLHAFTLMLGAAATLLADEHVRVDILYGRLSPEGQSLTDFCAFYLLLAPLMLHILWTAQAPTRFAWAVLEGSADADGIRGQFLLKTLIPAFAVLMLAQGVSLASRAAMRLRPRVAENGT